MATKKQNSNSTASTALVNIAQKAKSIEQVLQQNAEKIKATLPRHITVDKMIAIVMNSIRRTPKIAECTPISVYSCVMQAAQLGIPPDDIRGLAYIIPFWNKHKNSYEAQLMPGYKGFIQLAKESGEIVDCYSRVVYSREPFTIREGTERILEHTPLPPHQRGEVIGAYTVLQLRNGIKTFTFMWEEEIQACRRRSKAANDGPWVTDTDEMRKKTTIRRAMKTLNLSPTIDKAVALDELVETEKSSREEFEDNDFLVETLPGKPVVSMPQAKTQSSQQQEENIIPPMHTQPELSPEDAELYTQIVDMMDEMQWGIDKTEIAEAILKKEGAQKALDYIEGAYTKWLKEKSREGKTATTPDSGMTKKSGTLL